MSTKKEKEKSPPVGDRIIRSVVMPPDLDVKLQAIAKAEDRSLSYMIVKAVREYIERASK